MPTNAGTELGLEAQKSKKTQTTFWPSWCLQSKWRREGREAFCVQKPLHVSLSCDQSEGTRFQLGFAEFPPTLLELSPPPPTASFPWLPFCRCPQPGTDPSGVDLGLWRWTELSFIEGTGEVKHGRSRGESCSWGKREVIQGMSRNKGYTVFSAEKKAEYISHSAEIK